MGMEDVGECSRKTDNNIEAERPLKKAKYVWQVKGKYHLKATAAAAAAACRQSKSSVIVDKEQKSLHHHQKIEKVKCDGTRYIDKFLEKTETILNGNNDEDDDDEDDDYDEDRKTIIDRTISNEIPVTLVSPNSENQDYYLRKWQARQIARGYIDNTINSVLETWVSVPAPFDAEDFVENCDEDGHIEDEGILMAIQAHGLHQSNKSSKKGPSLSSFVRPDELADNTLDKIDTVRHHQHQQQEDLPCEEEKEESNNKDIPIKNISNSSSSSDNGDGIIENNNNSVDNNVIYPVDILNAAILVAIEKKGLSSFTHHD